MESFTKAPMEWLVGILCVSVLSMLLYHAFVWQPSFPPLPPPETCKGVPIFVTYPFESGYLEPHACKVQCEDPSQQRFVLYSDGQATQCGIIPNCLDIGEDTGVTCTVPAEYTNNSTPTI